MKAIIDTLGVAHSNVDPSSLKFSLRAGQASS
jgi:hypothetical protein